MDAGMWLVAGLAGLAVVLSRVIPNLWLWILAVGVGSVALVAIMGWLSGDLNL